VVAKYKHAKYVLYRLAGDANNLYMSRLVAPLHRSCLQPLHIRENFLCFFCEVWLFDVQNEILVFFIVYARKKERHEFHEVWLRHESNLPLNSLKDRVDLLGGLRVDTLEAVEFASVIALGAVLVAADVKVVNAAEEIPEKVRLALEEVVHCVADIVVKRQWCCM